MQKGVYDKDTGRQEVELEGGSGGTGGGGASTIADGADVTQGALADSSVSAGATGTISAKLRRISADIDSIKTNTSGLIASNVIVNGTFTRPADTTAYAAGDVVSDSTSSPTVITFTNASRQNAGNGTIIGATLIDSANQSTKGVFELWVFDTTLTPDNDNAVFTPSDAEATTLVGIIPFDVSFIGDATSGGGGNSVYQANFLSMPFVTGASSRNLFGVLVVRNAYTPVSAESFTIRLAVLQK